MVSRQCNHHQDKKKQKKHIGHPFPSKNKMNKNKKDKSKIQRHSDVDTKSCHGASCSIEVEKLTEQASEHFEISWAACLCRCGN